ncbi:hypothetical protein Aros01_08342 [Streptosporangium roseum]
MCSSGNRAALPSIATPRNYTVISTRGTAAPLRTVPCRAPHPADPLGAPGAERPAALLDGAQAHGEFLVTVADEGGYRPQRVGRYRE